VTWVRQRIPALRFTLDDTTAKLGLAFDVAKYFGVSATDARVISREVGHAVAQWSEEAGRFGLERRAIDRMASAFEHDDLRQSLA
jgi:serine/threonine-protein kinase HipA